MLPTRDSLQLYKAIKTEREVIEKVIPRKWKWKEIWGSNTYTRQTRFKTKTGREDKDNTWW